MKISTPCFRTIHCSHTYTYTFTLFTIGILTIINCFIQEHVFRSRFKVFLSFIHFRFFPQSESVLQPIVQKFKGGSLTSTHVPHVEFDPAQSSHSC